MTASKRKRYKEHAAKREAGGYVPMPHAVLRSPEFAALSPRAVKALCSLLAQYRGNNNGDLCGALSLMHERGWRSKGGLADALTELEHAQFIVRTRQGGKHRATLYAVSFFAIDYCDGKLDLTAPTRSFMGSWRRVGGAPPAGQNSRTASAPQAGQTPNDCPTDGAITEPKDANCPAGRPNQAANGESCAPPAGSSIDLPLPAADARRRCESC